MNELCEKMDSELIMQPENNEWRTNKTFEERFQYLYSSSLFSDIEFNVVDDNGLHIFKAHSTVLCIASPVFERMLFNDNFDRSRSIMIVDVESEFFDLFLKFIYNCKIDLKSVEEAWALYYLGEKYLFSELKDFCLPYILNSVNSETACVNYEMARMYNLEDLAESCLEFIIGHTEQVVNSLSFLKANKETIFTILDEKKLNIREADLLVGVIKWATHQKSESKDHKKTDEDNHEATLKISKEDNHGSTFEKSVQKKKRCDLIKKILSNVYFMDITADEFVCKVRGTDVLTNDESLPIIMKLVSQDVEEWPRGFKKCKRANKDVPGESDIFKLVFDEEGSELLTQETWGMSFLKVNTPILVVGFEISCGENPSNPLGRYREKSQLVILDLHTGAGTSVDVQQYVVYGSKLRVDLTCPFPAFTDTSYQIGIITDDKRPRHAIKFNDRRFEKEDVSLSILSPSHSPLTGIYFCKINDDVID